MRNTLLLTVVILLCSLSLSVAEKPDDLIIGDSISLGYTPNVPTMMQDEANVVRHQSNTQHTGMRVAKMDARFGDTDRDTIQFTTKRADLVSRVFFGSCIKQDQPIPLLKTMADQSPDLMIFLGDNIYGDTQDMDVLRAKYRKLGSDKGFQRLRRSCPLLATWDDHDFGVNDGGADYPKRKESERIFEDFWFDEASTKARSRPGIYDARFFGPPGKRLQVIMLDTRYFRSPLKRGDKRIGGPWIPDHDPSKTMLGEAQWEWLKEQLTQPADVRIIASSIQFIAEDVGQETWSNLPCERQRMLDLLKTTKANGVIFVSGDRHWSELSTLSEDVPYRLYDFTSSSFNQLHKRGTPTKNRFRLLTETYHEENYGVISIDWSRPTPVTTLEMRDLSGDVQWQHQVNWAL